ncbi:MAG: ATP-binding protein, partial [Candidatus Promineifilaceae bacterium]
HRLKDLREPEQLFQVNITGLRQDFPPLKSLSARLHNLPAESSSFVGREQEVADLVALLEQSEARLVTLTGPGGTGKTRLALQAGRALLGRYGDGVFFVPLAEASSAELVVSKTSRALELREGTLPPLETLQDYLRDKEMLLLLDNFEQVLEAADVVTGLLEAAPDLHILVTSRILLAVRAEHNYPVPTLSLPAARSLFIERAAASNPRLVFNASNMPLVDEICRRLDGLPLAIELAAARVRLLPLQNLLARLGERLDLLTGGMRDLPRRQQTLRGAIDWSYELLAQEEQRLLARLSIFVGGFTLKAAEAVCTVDGDLDVFSGVEALLDQSLLKREDYTGGSPRLAMLESIREYAAERLAQFGEEALLQGRHGAYFAEQMQGIGLAYYSPDAVAALDWTDREHDNLRAMLSRGLQTEVGRGTAPRVVIDLCWYWYRRGYVTEGRDWSERVLSTQPAGERSGGRALALGSCALMAMWQGDLYPALEYATEFASLAGWLEDDTTLAMATFEKGIIQVNRGQDKEARDLLREAHKLFEQIGHPFFAAISLVHQANALLGLGDFGGATRRLDEAKVLVEQINEPWLTSFALNNRGEVARAQRRYEEARGYYVESERILREVGDVGDLARLVHTLAYVDQHEGDLPQAEARFREALAIFRKVGNQRGIAECLAGLAGVLAAKGAAVTGATLLGAAEALQDAAGAAWWPADRVEIERNTAVLRTALGDDVLAAALAEGRLLKMDEAVALALSDSVD